MSTILKVTIAAVLLISVFPQTARGVHPAGDFASLPAVPSSDHASGYGLHSPFDRPWGDWRHYHNYTEIVDTLLYLNVTYPTLVDVSSIGKSWQNRDIYAIKLTNENISAAKPKVLFVGFHHAREPISAELPLYFAVDAVSSYGANAAITRMIDYCEIHMVVALNVDAFDVIEQNEWHRKNLRSIDEDGDGLLDEDPPDDEDGDGYVESLWQGGSFIRWEGTDDDHDGQFNEDWIGGVDLNRNYGYEWNATVQSGSSEPSAEAYRGPTPFSEPETQALRDFAMQHDFKYAISFHSGAEIIVYPWGHTTEPPPDEHILRQVAGNLSTLVEASFGQAGAWYTTSGNWDDWMYGNRSTLAFTCEVYRNGSAWQYEPGPLPNSRWQRGVFEFFNPDPSRIELTIQRWLPTLTYTINRAIIERHIGDVNGDKEVDMRDVAIASLAFGSYPEHPRWNNQADLNYDNRVDIRDLALIASNFGKTYSGP